MDWSRLILCAGLSMSVASCNRGLPEGSLLPVTSPGIEVVSGDRSPGLARPNDTARIRSGEIVADIAGRWMTEGGQDFDVTVTNGSPRELRLPASNFGLTHKGETSRVLYLIDVTGVNAADDRTDNDQFTTLYDFEKNAGSPVPELIVPARTRRQFSVTFGNFLRPGNQIKKGNELIAEVPMTGSPPARVRFVAD